jgi:soluble lytic murein transglycosylase-like protein
MMRLAAPQHLDSEALPPSVLKELLVARVRSEEIGRSTMNNVSTLATRAFAATRATLALIGFVALAGYLLLPHAAQTESWLAGLPAVAERESAAAGDTGPIPAAILESPLELEQRAVTEYIAKRYRVSDQAVGAYVALAYQAGAQHSVDPLLILAVMAIESRYNPVAESSMGARGLMQVIPKYHLEKLLDHGGEPALLEPAVNIVVGAQILREYQRRFRDTETALQMYGGALDDVSTQYAAKVLAEKARLDALKVKARKQQTAQAV